MPSRLDPFLLLERTDKWYLGGGNAAMFAPAFPKALDTPGFWDEAYFADIRLERLFCLLLLDENGRPLNLRRALRRWTPDRLMHIHTVEGVSTLRVHDERVVTPNDTLACKLTLTNSGAEPLRLHLLAWSLPPQCDLPPDAFAATAAEVQRDPDALHYAYRLHYGQPGDTPAEVYGWGEREGVGCRVPGVGKADQRPTTDDEAGVGEPSVQATETQGEEMHFPTTDTRHPTPALYVALGGNHLPDSWTVNLAETTDTAPLWPLSVFPEKFQKGQLPQEMQVEAGWNPNGLLHLALHFTLEVPAGASESLTVGAAIALTRETALEHLRSDMTGDVVAQSRESWTRYFDSVPYFECDDVYLERAYWYRWYGLRLLAVNVQAGQLPYPCVFEGIGAFRSHISYSAQCHIRETSWLPDRALAMGSLENFLANQVRQEGDPEDGFLPGHLYLWRRDRGFYHADWGGAALQVYYLKGDVNFVRRVTPALCRYAAYFDRERDREQSGMYDVVDQGETGQEYMSRYLFADAKADSWGKIQIKGIDATCYLYSLQRALAIFTAVLGQETEAAAWTEKANATREAVREFMWDPDARIFKDVSPQAWKISPYKAAVGFLPFLTDIGTRMQCIGLNNHLRMSHTFGTPFPVPASSVDDPYFNATAEWKGKRTNCPWNGRVWPMASWQVIAATARAARVLDSNLASLAADLLRRFIHMLFHEGDPKRPNCYEHYNPFTGTPSLYRGVDDYQHSCVVDLIMKLVVGIQPEPAPNGALVIDPMPYPTTRFRAEGIPVRGHCVDVLWSQIDGFVVRVDGEVRALLPEPQKVEILL